VLPDEEPPAKRRKKRLPPGNKRNRHLTEADDDIEVRIYFQVQPRANEFHLKEEEPSSPRVLTKSITKNARPVVVETISSDDSEEPLRPRMQAPKANMDSPASTSSVSVSPSSSVSPLKNKKSKMTRVLSFAGIKDTKWLKELNEKAVSLGTHLLENISIYNSF